ncbi:hypothetical protein [Micromonospora sp. HM5-17]|jgi:hypothetical protein|uniref:hypothetical protein n=1 Tax=Micromonospora sp. HM5-17 TaxID=2487710 RepID=UPI000F472458|nr:hypothetical protein [Micromonospora sp. HM5-17]ROT33225.1 hypothetical protein EF879_08985 [Micromonospora sp. HM5-17]
MTDDDRHVWRDEERLPLAELTRAVATSTPDGQVDDVTGNDAGEESAFGHGAAVDDAPRDAATEPDRTAERADDQRRHRPSTTGRNGPH